LLWFIVGAISTVVEITQYTPTAAVGDSELDLAKLLLVINVYRLFLYLLGLLSGFVGICRRHQTALKVFIVDLAMFVFIDFIGFIYLTEPQLKGVCNLSRAMYDECRGFAFALFFMNLALGFLFFFVTVGYYANVRDNFESLEEIAA
jgi:hypothetical protein